jgi:Omp85 superfamily domain
MMHSCASAAKLRGAGPILFPGVKAKRAIGTPPPRTVIGTEGGPRPSEFYAGPLMKLDARRYPLGSRPLALAEVKQDFAGVGGNVRFFRTTADLYSYREVFPDIVGVLHLQGGRSQAWAETTSRWGPIWCAVLPRGNWTARSDAVSVHRHPGGCPGRHVLLGASFELQTPLYFLPKDAGIKVAAFADAGSLWNYTGPTIFPAAGEVISGNFCPTFGPGIPQCGAVSDRQRHACSHVGRAAPDLGIAVWAAAPRLFVPAHKGALRPGSAVPLRRRHEILNPPAAAGG